MPYCIFYDIMSQQQTGINDRQHDSPRPPAEGEPLSFDETVRRALAFCDTLPGDFAHLRGLLAELQTRLSKGRLHFAVLGQFNRGKSTFINAMLGIKALPASVLPLTSVPTIIEYGAELSCRIRFLDGKDDLTVSGAAELMESTLRQYVAEENNPRNRLNVKDAVVTCASGLLANGTALIDTPGFGSTHLHNTQTTLDLLIECDAALFLLSADPPMTQTEMEFLRHVKERVPKIFFILNKVDLLTPEGLEEVDRFIRNILYKDLGFPADTALYHTSAIKGKGVIKDKNDVSGSKNINKNNVNGRNDIRDKSGVTEKKNASGPYDIININNNISADTDGKDAAAQDESGLEAVKREVLDFMVREKYFTLSEALQDKYREAVTAIKSLLDEKLGKRLAPINAAREEVGAITGAIQSLSLELESEIKKCAKEREALETKIGAWASENPKPYAQSMNKALGVLLNDRYIPDEAASIASTLLPRHADDLGAQLLCSMIELANKSIRKLALRHALEFSRLQKRYAGLLGGAAADTRPPEELAARLEISASGRRGMFESETLPTPQPQLTNIFRKKSIRFEAVREFYEPLCARIVAANIARAAALARSLTDAAWTEMQKAIRASYQEMIDVLKQLHKAKQSGLDAAQEGAKAEIAFLKEKIRECPKVG